MTVSDLIKALDLVGQVYRSKDGTEPADAVRKILRQLGAAADVPLDAWVRQKQAEAKPRGHKSVAKPVTVASPLDAAISALERAQTQERLAQVAQGIRLSAGEWRNLARRLTGKPAKSGKAARQLVEAHFSDQLLLQERVESVRRQFG